METPQHLNTMTILIDSLQHAWAQRDDFFVGGNMFVYFSPNQVKQENYRGPDFFVVLNTQKNVNRYAWVVWEEQGRTPDMVIELSSPSTKEFDLKQKREIYRKNLKTPDYFVFDPHDPTYFRGWHLVRGRYQELQRNDRGWLWCESLGLWVGPWTGTLKEQTRTWLRFYDTNGQLLLTAEEDERRQKEVALKQVALERQQKEDALTQATVALQQVALEQQQKEDALTQAEMERQQKEEALQREAKQRQQLEKLKELLRVQGLSEAELNALG